MSVRKLPAVAILASSVILPLAAPNSAIAESCLTAPKGAAPGGGHWYYRLERPSMRKCWRLVAKGEQGAARTATRGALQRSAQKPAAPIEPQGDIDEEAEAAPAPTPPPARAAAAPKPAPIPPADGWLTREASNTVETAQPLPLPPPDPVINAAPRADTAAPPAPPVQTAQAQAAPVIVAEPPAGPAKSAKASNADSSSMLRWVPAVLALLALLGGAGFYLRRTMRRRSDVLTVLDGADSDRLDAPPTVPAAGTATFDPLPPIGLRPREDDIEDALRRFAQNWKRSAA